MILKRQEKGTIIKAMYDSSNILASIYNTETNDLTLIFSKGTQYKYPKVSLTDYTRFEIAESQGKVFNTHIKPYSFEKLGDVDPALILKEVGVLKEAEDKALQEANHLQLVSMMKSMISLGIPYSAAQLSSLQDAITKCLSKQVVA
jgi:hypothetical protein